ncbi:hypothetical protein [Halobacteriovorax marinus]|uniref:hypothetical protein n=1 Tax=Halobacteriovorax marinus TaxID=97084 RepID=UPI003A9064A9
MKKVISIIALLFLVTTNSHGYSSYETLENLPYGTKLIVLKDMYFRAGSRYSYVYKDVTKYVDGCGKEYAVKNQLTLWANSSSRERIIRQGRVLTITKAKRLLSESGSWDSMNIHTDSGLKFEVQILDKRSGTYRTFCRKDVNFTQDTLEYLTDGYIKIQEVPGPIDF